MIFRVKADEANAVLLVADFGGLKREREKMRHEGDFLLPNYHLLMDIEVAPGNSQSRITRTGQSCFIAVAFTDFHRTYQRVKLLKSL